MVTNGHGTQRQTCKYLFFGFATAGAHHTEYDAYVLYPCLYLPERPQASRARSQLCHQNRGTNPLSSSRIEFYSGQTVTWHGYSIFASDPVCGVE